MLFPLILASHLGKLFVLVVVQSGIPWRCLRFLVTELISLQFWKSRTGWAAAVLNLKYLSSLIKQTSRKQSGVSVLSRRTQSLWAAPRQEPRSASAALGLSRAVSTASLYVVKQKASREPALCVCWSLHLLQQSVLTCKTEYFAFKELVPTCKC